MFLREITEKPAIKYSDEELSDDLLFYIEFDSDFYRREVYPELVRFKSLAKKSDNVKTTFFVPMLMKAVKFYCDKFDEDSSRDCFKTDNLKQLSAQLYNREMDELHKDVEKKPRNANPNVNENISNIKEAGVISSNLPGMQKTQHSDGSSTTNYQVGPLQTTQKVDAQGRPIKSTAQYTTNLGKLGTEQDHVSGIRTTTATPTDPNADPNAILPTSSIAAARGVDPKKFASFQRQNTTDDVNPDAIRKNVKSSKLKDTVNEISPDTVKGYMKGAIKDTLAGKNRNPGISRAMSRLSGTNQSLLPGETMPSISDLHLEISDHLALPLDRFKLNLIDAEFLGDYLVKYARVLARKYEMNVDDVQQFINDYVEDQLGDLE